MAGRACPIRRHLALPTAIYGDHGSPFRQARLPRRARERDSPLRLRAMLDLLDRIAVDPEEKPGPDHPVRQVLVNTYSPIMVQMLEPQGRPGDLLIAEPAVVRLHGAPCRTARFRHRAGTWREARGGPGVGPGIAEAYLTLPAGSEVPMMVADGR